MAVAETHRQPARRLTRIATRLARIACATLIVAACSREVQEREPDKSHFSLLDSLRCARVEVDGRCIEYDVSIYELLANPMTYDHKRVMIMGYAHLGFEVNGIYPHREDLVQGLAKNGLWLSAPPGSDSVSDHYVIVEGRFLARAQGHLGLWSGTIDSITRLDRVDTPRVVHLDTTNLPTIDLSRPSGKSPP